MQKHESIKAGQCGWRVGGEDERDGRIKMTSSESYNDDENIEASTQVNVKFFC